MSRQHIDQNKLMDDLRLYLKTYAEEYCKEGAKEITAMAAMAIQSFYNNYTPEYYDRTEDLLKNSYSLYYHNNGNTIYGGVKISSINMQPYVGAGISQYDIAYSAWTKGLHGFENRDSNMRIHTFPPVAMIEMEIRNKSFLNRLDKKASLEARKNKYDYISDFI